MAKRQIFGGATSEVWTVYIQDSTAGAGKTGLVYNTASLTCYYKRNKAAAAVSVTLANITTLGTFVSGGFKEVDATNMPGVYEFHPPDAAIAASAESVSFLFNGAAGMSSLPLEVEIMAVNFQNSVRMGMTALPNAAAEAAGGLFTRGTGAGQINQDANGRIDANMMAIFSSVLSQTNNLAAAFKKFFDVASPATSMDTIFSAAAMVESYAADGATATPAQMLYMLWSMLVEMNIVTTTVTAKKLDGSTTAMTFTLNDPTNPTSITRAT